MECRCGARIALSRRRFVHVEPPRGERHYAVAADQLAAYMLRVDRSGGPESCWSWTGAHRRNGYSILGGRDAHRVLYELLVGPVPDGLQLDHLCRNGGCINPAHLEPVTGRENCMRGISFAAANARKTHCQRGHEYDAENTYLLDGRRYCRACTRINGRNYRRRLQSRKPSRSAVPDGPLPSRGPLTRTARRPAPERVPGKRSGSR